MSGASGPKPGSSGSPLPSILVAGPYPPPVHGFAVITSALADRLETRGRVKRCNLAARPSAGIWRTPVQIVLALRAAAAILAHRLGGGRAVVVGVNGGLGQFYTLLLLLAARLSHQRLYLHHHSYSYVNRHSMRVALLCRVAGSQAIHVLLADGMAAAFQARYPVAQRAVVLQNAVFVPAVPATPRVPGPLRVGLISNLSREKGLYDFLETAARLGSEGVAVEMMLAGPVALHQDRAAIDRAVARGEVAWHGPVYGPEKDRFFANIDILLFPTRYVHEAQPTVIYEAMAAGAGVIAFDRGAIRDQVRDCLHAVPADADFAAVAVGMLRDLAGEGEEGLARIAARARDLHAEDSRLGAAVVAGMAR